MLRRSGFSDKWPVVPLSEVVTFLDNLRKPVKASERVEGDYAYYGANGLQGSIDGYLFDESLVLLAEDGGHFGNPDRDIAYIATGKYWVNNHAHVLKPKDNIDLTFLYRVLQRYDVTPFIKGATRAKLTKGDASRIPVPLPPLPEQKRIAAILDKADQLRQKRQQAIGLADEFLRSVFLDMFGDPVTNPKGWEVKPLKSLVNVMSGGTPSKKNETYWSGEFPWVSPKDMKSVEISDALDHISDSVFTETNLKKVPTSSILIVVRGMILAHTVPVAITTRDVAINQDMKAFTCTDYLLPNFLLWFLKSQHEHLLSKVSSAAHGTKRFEMDDLLSLPVFLPSLELQKHFSEITQKFKSFSAV
ncbi:restriction endonuclease subunit S, partial [Sansalvadorimonas verongulae]|uniref:restriction endonuclease subunit S n=1 Tax=Sansalvadorimonas verongulae TaxID=2172824 RepID=UPI001E3ED3C5